MAPPSPRCGQSRRVPAVAEELQVAASATPTDEWNALLEQFDSNVYHDPRWIEATLRPGADPVYFSWSDAGGECRAIAAAHLRRSGLPVIGRWNSTLNIGSTPAGVQTDSALFASVMRSLKREAKRMGCRALTMESHMGYPVQGLASRIGLNPRPRLEFRIPLQDEPDDIFSRFSSHHRRKVRKAGRSELRVAQSDDVAALRSLQRGSQARRNARGESMHLGGDEPVINAMRKMLATGLARLYLAELDDEFVSGALVSWYRNRAYYVFGGSSPDGFRMNAPALVFWRMICDAKDDGLAEFNLGGVPGAAVEASSASHGLYRFKAGFGGDIVELADVDANLRPAMNAIAALRSRLSGS